MPRRWQLRELAGPYVNGNGRCLMGATPTVEWVHRDPNEKRFIRSVDCDDAGHFQIEMTLVDYTYDRESFNGMTKRFEAWEIASMNLKIGLLNQLDAQLVLETYNLLYERQGGSRVTR